MGQDRLFERKYSLNVARLGFGSHQDAFDVDDSFFEHFEASSIREGQVHIDLSIQKASSHMDVSFHLQGEVTVSCDRCNQPYQQPLDERYRIIYAFRPGMDFNEEEVIVTDPMESHLSLVQEIYDFIHLSVPMRRVPPPEIHSCEPGILSYLLTEKEEEEAAESREEEAEARDPRWAALRKLKDQLEP
jgi:uncharacterized metal-binding protein YceD (DUF177 family)